MRFDKYSDYKTAFKNAVNALIDENIEDRTERMKRIESLITSYVLDIGERPVSNELERLADYTLKEELTDMDRMKVRNNEYPFFSERQFQRRESGETSMKVAEEVGTDGRNYKTPTRRKRAPHENNYVDACAKSRNKARKEQYRKDSTTSECVTVFTASREALDNYLIDKYGEHKLAFSR